MLEKALYEGSEAYLALSPESQDDDVGSALLTRVQEMQSRVELRRVSASGAQRILKRIGAAQATLPRRCSFVQISIALSSMLKSLLKSMRRRWLLNHASHA